MRGIAGFGPPGSDPSPDRVGIQLKRLPVGFPKVEQIRDYQYRIKVIVSKYSINLSIDTEAKIK